MSISKLSTKLAAAGLAAAAVLALGLVAPAANAAPAATTAPAKPTIVLVHGAWADASSFAPVTAALQKDGYTVLSAPNPLRGIATDAASVASFVNQATTGPVVLVGHSYGGTVITNAATQTPTVQALVYIDAYAPDQGETIVQLTGSQPGSLLGVPDPSTVFNFVQFQNDTQTGTYTAAYVKPELFQKIFAADLPQKQAQVLAASQEPLAVDALGTASGEPAWKTIKSYFFIGTNDKVIPAAEQLHMATRANGVVVKAEADHLSMLEVPDKITDLIETAAKND